MPEDTQLAPMPEMPNGLAVGERTITKDPQSGAETRTDIMAQCSVPASAFIITAVDNMQDKAAQGKILSMLETNQAHVLEEDTKAHDRYEARKDAERASADLRRLIITCAGIGICSILLIAVLFFIALENINLWELVIILSFTLLITLGLCKGSVLNISINGKTKDTSAGVSIQADKSKTDE